MASPDFKQNAFNSNMFRFDEPYGSGSATASPHKMRMSLIFGIHAGSTVMLKLTTGDAPDIHFTCLFVDDCRNPLSENGEQL